MRTVWTLLLSLLIANAADWPMALGDAQHSGRQQHERDITPSTVKQFRLLWKASPGATLSAPVIVGRLITYRGTVELVFVASSNGDVYAVDGDFGKIFWQRHLELTRPVCAGATPASPAFAPSNLSAEEEDDDGPQALRPLYVVTADGRLHTLHPQDGRDLEPARDFVNAGSRIANLRVVDSKPSTSATTCTAQTSRKASPVSAGGVRFAISGGSLHALDAANGRELFKSPPEPGDASELAVANGHVCFTRQTTLYCYGLPVDQ